MMSACPEKHQALIAACLHLWPIIIPLEIDRRRSTRRYTVSGLFDQYESIEDMLSADGFQVRGLPINWGEYFIMSMVNWNYFAFLHRLARRQKSVRRTKSHEIKMLHGLSVELENRNMPRFLYRIEHGNLPAFFPKTARLRK